jgi:hypothetical protein
MLKLDGARRRSQLRSTFSAGGGIGISRQYEAHRPAWGVSRCAGDLREQPKVADAASEIAARRLERQKALSTGVWRCKVFSSTLWSSWRILEVE